MHCVYCVYRVYSVYCVYCGAGTPCGQRDFGAGTPHGRTGFGVGTPRAKGLTRLPLKATTPELLQQTVPRCRHGHARQPEARNPGKPPLRALPRCRHGHAKQAVKTATLETAPESWQTNFDSLYSDVQKEPYPPSPHLNHGVSCTTQSELAKSSPSRAASAHANPMIQMGVRGAGRTARLLNCTVQSTPPQVWCMETKPSMEITENVKKRNEIDAWTKQRSWTTKTRRHCDSPSPSTR